MKRNGRSQRCLALPSVGDPRAIRLAGFLVFSITGVA